jgi:hypothetical protein
MQIREFIGRCHCAAPFLQMSVLDAAGPKLPRRETGKVTHRGLCLLLVVVSREACVKRISIRHASCAPPLSQLGSENAQNKTPATR